MEDRKTYNQVEESVGAMQMLIHDDTFNWDGFGGKLRLASGKCRLRIFDMLAEQTGNLMILRPIIVVLTDIAGQKVTVRSCAGHIATQVAQQFDLNPGRTLWVEHYPASQYGVDQTRTISEKFDIVDFVWNEGLALHPKWREMKPPMVDEIKQLIERS